jgi:glycosyltransferase involved in cell wall biosynthesis
VVGVSDYVARRKVDVDLVPADRVQRIWNSVTMPLRDPQARARLRHEFQLPEDALVVVCACRAAREKGVEHLLHAFDRTEVLNGPDAVLVFMGDGPDMERLIEIRKTLSAPQRVIFAGYRTDAAELLEGADVAVVPSVWAEAFGLSALEPMARGVPVIASRVGGIPEVVADGETGLLVEPGNATELSAALARLLGDADERRRLGENGRVRAATHFTLENEIDELTSLIAPAFTVMPK